MPTVLRDQFTSCDMLFAGRWAQLASLLGLEDLEGIAFALSEPRAPLVNHLLVSQHDIWEIFQQLLQFMQIKCFDDIYKKNRILQLQVLHKEQLK